MPGTISQPRNGRKYRIPLGENSPTERHKEQKSLGATGTRKGMSHSNRYREARCGGTPL